MKHQHIKAVRSAITAVALMASALAAAAQTTDNRAPEVPSTIQVEEGNKVHFKAYATGVQIYRWNGTAWRFVAPEAMLFDMDGGIVGIHYVGPTWESASGSKVVGTRVNGAPEWLHRLVAAERHGFGGRDF
jgi:hypothetical protein